MSADKVDEIQSAPTEVDTFRTITGEYWSEAEEEDDESSGESNGCLKNGYSYNDITEELIKNGDTLRIVNNQQEVDGDANRNVDPIYENLTFGTDSPVYASGYLDYDGWSSSEFDDSDETPEIEQTESSGSKPFDFFHKTKKQHPPKTISMPSDGLRMSKGKSFLAGIKKNAKQSSMLERFSKFGQRKVKQDEIQQEVDADLQPLNFGLGNKTFKPACLPPFIQDDISAIQMKRRQIVNVIVESEKSYLYSLKRLIEEYQQPLIQSQPSIIDYKHIKVIFHKIRDIIQCHLLFHGELLHVVDKWDQEEKIGDVFIASFSKSMVFEAYSSFVNNFQAAMDRAKKQARLKPAFNTFLKDKLDTSNDKLSLFGLMVKPVQRFPQFIMLIQDLLKNTPRDHADRLSLQWALTELEMLTDRLNETKKECESLMEAKRLSKVLHLGGLESKFIRQDDVMQHKMREGETESKLKRLFMLSDQLVCASVNKHKESAEAGDSMVSISGEKLVVTWSSQIKDIEVSDPTLPSLKSQPFSRQSFQSINFKKPGRTCASPPTQASLNPYRKDLNNMLHDLKIFEEMSTLHSKLKLKYEALPIESFKGPIASLEMLIRQKIDIDKNIVTISIPTSRGKKSITLEFSSLTMKHDWLIELQSAKLAIDPNNFPAWFLSENDPLSSRNPRFMKALKMDAITKEDKKMTLKPKKKIKDELNCCTYVTLPCHNKPGSGIRHLWACIGGRAAIVSLHTNQPFVVECFHVTDGNIVASECISDPSPNHDLGIEGLLGDGERVVVRGESMNRREVVWMVSDDNKIFMVPVIQDTRQEASKPIKVDGSQVRCMKYLNEKVYLGTSDGTLIIYSRTKKGEWNFTAPQKISLGTGAVSFLMVVDDNIMWASCSFTVHVLGLQLHPDDADLTIVDVKASHSLTNDIPLVASNGLSGKKSLTTIECMVKAGVGLLVSFTDQSTVCLFHAETFQHLQDINISSAINQLLEEKGTNLKPDQSSSSLSITCMLQNKGILYIGTNHGFVLTLPLPRLNGMPQFRQRPAISFQGHVGPVKFLASINCSLVDGNGDKNSSSGDKKINPSHRNSSDTLIGDEIVTPPSHEYSEPIEIKQNGDDMPTSLTTNLSASTPDLAELPTADFKLQQMNSLYESLWRGVMENADDMAVLQRIASTPLPHRRHRLQNMIKSVMISDRDRNLANSQSPHDNHEVLRRSKNSGMRHSMSEILEISTDQFPLQVDEHALEDGRKEQKSSGDGDQKDDQINELSKIDVNNESFKSNGPLVMDSGNTLDKETSDEITKLTSHLSKSVSSASDTPSQRSSSSTSSSAKRGHESLQADDKFSSFSRVSIPSSTAMISSTLTTTPKSRAIVFVSAGKGYIPWNSSVKNDSSNEKSYLLLWMC